MDKNSKILLNLFIVVVLVAIALAYYRSFFVKDFLIQDSTETTEESIDSNE
ncbi:MAG: hypothetical protein QG640_714 [Patescibacteria group bacterium]|nr:hypothetical protein [Patescibacteria group bacterium]